MRELWAAFKNQVCLHSGLTGNRSPLLALKAFPGLCVPFMKKCGDTTNKLKQPQDFDQGPNWEERGEGRVRANEKQKVTRTDSETQDSQRGGCREKILNNTLRCHEGGRKEGITHACVFLPFSEKVLRSQGKSIVKVPRETVHIKHTRTHTPLG